jgi:hypothetical protein
MAAQTSLLRRGQGEYVKVRCAPVTTAQAAPTRQGSAAALR